jgi:hypothetical protein
MLTPERHRIMPTQSVGIILNGVIVTRGMMLADIIL